MISQKTEGATKMRRIRPARPAEVPQLFLGNSSLRDVADFELAGNSGGEEQHDAGEDYGTKHGGNRAYRLTHHRKQRQKALGGNRHRAQLLEIVSYAGALHQRRQNRTEGFPTENNDSGNDRVAKQKAQRKKDRSIADAGQDGHPEVCPELS